MHKPNKVARRKKEKKRKEKNSGLMTHTLVAGCNRVIRVAGEAGPANLMLPPSSNPGSGWNRDGIVVLVHDVGVAGKIGVVDVLDWVVAGWGANSPQLPL